MASDKDIQVSVVRLRKFYVVIACGLILLTLALFRVQVVKGAFYNNQLRQQSLRSVKLPAVRGRIFDRNGVCLADNRPSYGVALYFQELRREANRRRPRLQVGMETAATLSATLGLPPVSATAMRNHLHQKPSVPMILWNNLGADKMAVFAEQISSRPGVELVVTSVREYPLGERAAHLIGYLGRSDAMDDEREGYYLQPEMVGKVGIEAALDNFLRGKPGGRIVQLDALGFMEGVASEIPAEAGADVVLTIDARFQQLVEESLASAPMPGGRPVRGAVVLVDVTNGDILAMASAPSFDPNWFARGISSEEFTRLLNDAGRPFVNRAVRGTYPPGSVHKPFVMLAGLESGAITTDSSADCAGSFRIGNQTMACWARHGHGRVGIIEAMKMSCDVFFYQHGIKMGIPAIKRMADEFGFGERLGFILRESEGVNPDEAWLWERTRERWTDGRTANIAIGQGEVLVTPLQMAMATAAIANGGMLWQPRVVAHLNRNEKTIELFGPVLKRRIHINPQHIELVRRMMLEVVEGSGGTGGRARVSGVRVAGKTGTAEVGPRGNRRHMAWFTAFAPYEQPRYAIAVVIEDGDHGGTTAAPVAGKIFAGIFNAQHRSANEPVVSD